MAEIVNLGRWKKRQARRKALETAEENRARFGRTRAERARQARLGEAQAARLDGTRLQRQDKPQET